MEALVTTRTRKECCPNCGREFSEGFSRHIFNSNGEPVRFGAIERAILNILKVRSPHIVHSDHIFEEVYGYSENVATPETLRVHILHLRRKLQKNNLPWAIENAQGLGYKLVPIKVEVDQAA